MTAHDDAVKAATEEVLRHEVSPFSGYCACGEWVGMQRAAIAQHGAEAAVAAAAPILLAEKDAEIDRLRAILNEHKCIAREGPFPHRKQYRGGCLNVLVHERDRAAAVERARILNLLDEIPHDPSCHDDIECDCPIAFMRHAIAKTAPEGAS